MLPLVFRDGVRNAAVHIAGNGGHGGLQLVGDVGDEFLTPVLALAGRLPCYWKATASLLHFLGVIVISHCGLPDRRGRRRWRFRQLFQRAALPPGKGGDRQHGDQHHEQRRGEEDVGMLIHDLVMSLAGVRPARCPPRSRPREWGGRPCSGGRSTGR